MAWLLTLARDALAEAGLTAADWMLCWGPRPGVIYRHSCCSCAAKGLGLALGMPARGLSSLEAMAAGVADGAHHVAAIADSRRGSVFMALTGPDGESLSRRKTSPLKPQGKSWLRQARG